MTLAARRHQGPRHKRIMLGLFFGAICAVGIFTLLPGRIMHAIAVGG